MLKFIAEIDEFKGRWSAVRTFSPATLEALHQASKIESVAASTRIGGRRLSNETVASYLSAPAAKTERTQDETMAAGYAAALKGLRDQPAGSALTEAGVLQLHRILFQFCPNAGDSAGVYKKHSNFAAAYDEAGRQIGILFETTTPMQVATEMKRLLEKLVQMEEEGLHPLLITAIFLFRFLAIHPFQEGNGKLSGLLGTALLLRFGYAYVPYASLERMIEEDRGAYYASLRKTHQSLKWSTPEWEAWMEFFLDCLVRQKRKLERMMEVEKALPPDLSSLALAIAKLMEDHPRISVARILQGTGASRHAVRSALRTLIQHNLISPQGKGRSTHYTFPEWDL